MNCNHLQILLSGYVDDELPEKQTEVVERHISGCQDCRDQQALLRRMKNDLGSLESSAPDWSDFNKNVMAKIQQEQIRYNRMYLYGVAAAASFLLLASFLVLETVFGGGSGNKLEYSLSAAWAKLKEAEASKVSTVTHTHETIVANIPNYKLNRDMEGIKEAELTEEELDFLLKEGFVVTRKEFPSFQALYRKNQQLNIPSYITVESAISGLAHILGRLRLDMETGLFCEKLGNFIHFLSEQLFILHRDVPAEYKDSSLRTLAFMRVASVLLGHNETVWPEDILNEIQAIVDKELELIYNGSPQEKSFSIEESPIFGYPMDYNKFKVLWGEGQSDQLRRYYQTHEWFARCSFRASEAHISETRSALLILMAAIANGSDALIIWEEMHQVLTALYGDPDDPHLVDYLNVARDVYGESLTIDVLGDKNLLTRFCQKVARARLPRIRTELGLQSGLRIFGRRAIACDSVLQQLTYPYVGERDLPRIDPSILDIAVIMGSQKALKIARENGYFDYKDYEKRVELCQRTLKVDLDSANAPWKKGGLVGSAWIYDALMQPEGKGFPFFSHSEAWSSRKLTTIACGMLELANPKTVFVGKSQYSFSGTIDPYPEFFNRMATKIRSFEEVLRGIGYPMDQGAARELLNYLKVVKGLCEASRHMLGNEPLTSEDLENLRDFALGWEGDYDASNIHDLSYFCYRNSNDFDNFLYAGVGPIRELWVALPMNGKVRLARGGLFVFYEFQSMKKLTPEKWRKLSPKPGLAPWAKEFIKNH